MKKKVGVYICQCGTNIAGKVDTEKITAELAKENENIAVCRTYKYMCSEPGQKLIREDIEELGLDHVVEASCSPKMHEPTFRNACNQAGMNPYMFEMANIREHCSWVSEDPEAATSKAKDLVRAGVARVIHHQSLLGSRKPVNPTAMVVGGGIAGITAALKIGDAGYKVYLVEKDEIIGGRMAQFDKTFPTLDCAGCTLTPKTSEIGRHPNIEIMTKSQVESTSGFVGNFTVRVRQQPRYVIPDKCTGCGDCLQVCPVDFPSAFEEELTTRHPISRAFPQAIPNAFSILRAGSPPCEANCPAGVNATGYMTLTGLGKFEEALDLVRERMPFAAICGRICFHPCETTCKRGQLDKPLSIRASKRFLGDWELSRNQFKHPPCKPSREKRVAIIGSGPAGLSAAYYLALEGYEVTIFEKLPVAGGMLAVGIPAYRLPRDILDTEIENLKTMGITIRTGVTFGTDISYESLEADEYQAIFVATGLHKSRQLNVSGEDLQGVMVGTDLLRQTALDEPVTLGKQVVVIGGGNVAVDVSRTAKRLGAKQVTMVSLEKREEMPAWEYEVEDALEEGVKIINGYGPEKFIGQNGKITEIDFKKCATVFAEDGNFNPQYDLSDRKNLPADTVIVAIGQAPEKETIESLGLETGREGSITTDSQFLATSRPGVFAGGDCSLGAASFVEAVSHGRQAAGSIHSYLEYGGLKEVMPRVLEMDWQLTAEERFRAKPIERQPMQQLAAHKRRGNFDEVEWGLNAEAAQAEGQRCLHCGLCCRCGECVRSCGPQAIDLSETERIHEIDVGALIVATGIDTFDAGKYPEYGHGKYADVLTNLQFERLCNASGPTGGKVLRPSDGQIPRSIVFIQCVGSRDRAKGNEYCSKICCMISAKQLRIFKHHNPEGQAYVFYIDNRAGGKGYEEFLRQAIEVDGAQYIRGRVAKVYREGGRLVVRGENSLVGVPVEVEADLVVLATGLVAQDDYLSVARTLNLSTDKYGFFIEAHPKLAPVGTPLSGIFLAGATQGPKDIPESVAQGAAAGAEALALFGMGEVEVEPTVAAVDERLCTGCRTCEGLCPYNAVAFSDESKTATVNEAICQGCGTCAAACPTGAICVRHYTPDQICAQIEGLLA